MTSLSTLPRHGNGRIDWKSFFGGVQVGDEFIMPASLMRGISSSARNYAVSTRQHDNGDGTFTLAIIDAYTRERERMLADFSRLNHSQLKAIYHAGEKAGLFA